jgi:hypothetical protein
MAWLVRRDLSRRDVRLLASAFVAQVALGTAMRVAPISVLCRIVRRLRPIASRIRLAPEERVAWAIEAVGRRLPWISTCLVRALAADLLLSGPEGRGGVKIGVTRSEDGTLAAHAWYERGGRIVVGGAEVGAYVDFMTLDTALAERA